MTTQISALIRIKSKRSREQNSFDKIVLKNKNQIIIGRDIECDVCIKRIEISRKHAIIKYMDNNWFISDLESTNGLYINGRQLMPFTPHCLINRDNISFGPKDHSNICYQFIENIVFKPRVSKVETINCSESSKRKICQTIDSNERIIETKRVCDEDNDKQIEEIFKSELNCSVCLEMFVSAVTLNCSHTFCLTCIEEWKHSNEGNNECPICRQQIKNQNRALVLDNLIFNLVLKMNPQQREQRQQLIEEREQINCYSSQH